MASKYPSGMKLPVRPAPAPPPGHPAALPISKPSRSLMDSWDLSFDDPFSETFSKPGTNQSPVWPDIQTSKKKVPPPRPPPPKVAVGKVAGKSGLKNLTKTNSKQQPSRPSELLTNLFTRRGQKGESVSYQGPKGFSNKNVSQVPTPVSATVATASLIDLSSPPSSPTPTTRSSSDGLSVDSFGSDGTTSYSHHHSQVESGFEDDSELFGGFTATPSPVNQDPWASSPSTPSDVFFPVSSVASSKNPWGVTPQDPFSPPRKFTPSPSPTPTPTFSLSATAPTPGVVAFKPTIIRPKVKPNSSPLISRAKSTVSPSLNLVGDGENRSESPPMPSIPPPAPPAEFVEELRGSFLSSAESVSVKGSITQRAHCIALYDYESSHSEDLSFKEGDIIELVKEPSGEWLHGRIGNKEGIFPLNFVNVVIPLSDTGGVFATALYSFTPETWEDLDLQEGAKVRVLSRINNEWLYGECDGKRGQFPVMFVDNVPTDLPMHF